MSAEWNGAETARITARFAPSCEAISTARLTAAAWPEITVWSGELRFAAEQTSPFDGTLAGVRHDGGRQAHDGGHCADACGDGFLHVGAALANELDGVGEFQRASSYEGGIFAEAVAGHKIGSEAFFREDAIDGDRAGENGGLGIGGELQLVFGAFKADFGDGETEGLIGLVENGAGCRILFRQLFAHAGVLRCLTRKYECDFAHRQFLS